MTSSPVLEYDLECSKTQPESSTNLTVAFQRFSQMSLQLWEKTIPSIWVNITSLPESENTLIQKANDDNAELKLVGCPLSCRLHVLFKCVYLLWHPEWLLLPAWGPHVRTLAASWPLAFNTEGCLVQLGADVGFSQKVWGHKKPSGSSATVTTREAQGTGVSTVLTRVPRQW